MHTADDFLKAIEADPADRTRRLVFADWLDEHAQPERAELIRVEEEMRTLPVFADRFWELKPRRNALRTHAGPEWCERMRYGTECEPVFRHGIPDGWRERWRLIREFTERWHRIPMGDVGGRQKEVEEAETRLGRKLPPSVREWVAFAHDVPWSIHHTSVVNIDEGTIDMIERVADVDEVPGQASLSLLSSGGSHWGVPYSELELSDPTVQVYNYYRVHGRSATFEPDEEGNLVSPVTEFALQRALDSNSGNRAVFTTVWKTDSFLGEARAKLPIHARCGNLELHEMDNVLIAFGVRERESRLDVWVRISRSLTANTVAPFLQAFLKRPPALLSDGDPIPF